MLKPLPVNLFPSAFCPLPFAIASLPGYICNRVTAVAVGLHSKPTSIGLSLDQFPIPYVVRRLSVPTAVFHSVE